jgi:hypothetical protein
MPKILTQKQRAERRAHMAKEVAKLMARKVPVEVAVRRVAARHRVAIQTAPRAAEAEPHVDSDHEDRGRADERPEGFRHRQGV